MLCIILLIQLQPGSWCQGSTHTYLLTYLLTYLIGLQLQRVGRRGRLYIAQPQPPSPPAPNGLSVLFPLSLAQPNLYLKYIGGYEFPELCKKGVSIQINSAERTLIKMRGEGMIQNGSSKAFSLYKPNRSCALPSNKNNKVLQPWMILSGVLALVLLALLFVPLELDLQLGIKPWMMLYNI